MNRVRGLLLVWAVVVASAAAREGNPCLDCDRQMRKTMEAIQAWRRLHNGHYPGRLIDLQDAGLVPLNGSVCPLLFREGPDAGVQGATTSRIENGDPYGEYEYEMSDRVVKSTYARDWLPENAPDYTRQDVKAELLRRPFFEQVPILRCSRHRAVAPPPFDAKKEAWRNGTATGTIYWSNLYWEQLWLEDVPVFARDAKVLFGFQGPPFSSGRTPTLEEALDLRKWISASGDDAWWSNYPMSKDGGIRQPVVDLRALISRQPGRVVTLDGDKWWLDGLVQLQGLSRANGATNGQRFDSQKFVWERKGLPVGRSFSKASWIQGTVWPAPAGDVAGWLDWHYADGSVERVAMTYGKTTARFWGYDKIVEGEQGFPEPAWKSHEPAAAVGRDRWVRLYRQTWTNPHPEVTVTSLDFVSNRESPAAPFIMAVDVFQ